MPSLPDVAPTPLPVVSFLQRGAAHRGYQKTSAENMQRWIARLLVLVMIVPAFGPLAMARASEDMAPHCSRHPAQPVMQCHQGMALAMPMSSAPSSPETSFRAFDSCCQNHDCCRGLATPQWAQAPSHFTFRHALPTAEAPRTSTAPLTPSNFADSDSARAPPLL